jgi:small subunit ribosomal protein S16
MVRIRMQRMGRRHVNYFRINAVEKRVKRDGRVLENLGWYNPQAKDKAQQLHLEIDRIKHWIGAGAQPSDTIMDMLVNQGIVTGEKADEWKATKSARVEAKKASDAKKAANPQPEKKK